MTPSQRDRYLALLGLDPAPPSVAALANLLGAHLARLPFENVSKLVWAARGWAPGIPDLDEFLADAERLGTGGTCYRLNTAFNDLLRALGYEATLAGADMSAPDVHAANVVRLDGRPWLADVGYGAPLREPLPLDETKPITVARGPEAFTLHPAKSETHRLDHLRDGSVVHGYILKPAPRRPEAFAPAIADSFRPGAEFMNRLRVIVHTAGRTVSLLDLSVEVIEDDAARRTALADRRDLLDFAEADLGLDPALVAEACDALVARGHRQFA